MAKIVKIKGLQNVLANMNFYAKELELATPKSLKQGGLILQRYSQLEVPVGITGVLKGSAFTKVQPDKKSVRVGYDASYAVFVHEIITNQHNVGKAKYLTDPMEEHFEEIAEAIAGSLAKIQPRST